jgi:hypothetical protein
VALRSDAAAEKSEDQLSRDFLGCSIFDFCNNIGPIQTSGDVRFHAAVKGIADMDSVLIRSAPIY